MKKSRAPRTPAPESPAKDPALDDLEFPVAPGFKSLPPKVEFQAMLQRIAEAQPWLKPEHQKRRLERHGEHVEFVL